MLVELFAKNYTTFDGLVRGFDGIFKTSTSYHNKNHNLEIFPNPKTRILIQEKSIHLHTNNIQLD
jgi:hypothetical protein